MMLEAIEVTGKPVYLRRKPRDVGIEVNCYTESHFTAFLFR
jgi:hypothetical protein